MEVNTEKPTPNNDENTEKPTPNNDENTDKPIPYNDEIKEELPSKPKKKEFPVVLQYILIGLMIIVGTEVSAIKKVLLKLESKGIKFEQHHFFITFGMFTGELVNLIPYMIVLYKRKKNAKKIENSEKLIENISEDKKPPVKTNLIFAMTASCDLCGSTLYTFALTFLTTSMYQMLRGFELVFVCAFSKIFLKSQIYRHQYLGVGTLIIGLLFCGINSIIYANEDAENARNPLVGIILMIISMLFVATQFILQEKFIKNYSVHPFQLVGFEGLWGTLMYIILLTIFQFVSCDSWPQAMKDNICFKADDGKYRLEDTLFAFKQIAASGTVMGVFIGYVFSISIFNIISINFTKLVSSTGRAIIDTARTVFVWLFFLCFEPVPGVKEHFYPVQFVGFIFLIFGTLVYNEIVALKFWGLDYYLRVNIAKRKEEEELKNNLPLEENRLFKESDAS